MVPFKNTSIRPVSAAPPVARAVPPLLLPLWLPLVLTAIATGVLLAWLTPASESPARPPALRFTDITTDAGISFIHRSGAEPGETPTTLGGGVVFLDYDNDGDPDLFLVNGTDWPWEETLAKEARRGCALFRNEGDGRFIDVTAYSGTGLVLQGMGGAAGDFDNDGLTDLFLTGVGANHLFRNRGQGRFEDVTESAGVGGDLNEWSTGATWIDFDSDGRLDLVVCHYARWPEEVGLGGAFSVALMGRSYGTPTGFLGVPPTVYRNIGGGRFVRVPGSAGLVAFDRQTGLPVERALAIVPGDANNDRRLDLLCTFHDHPAVLFLNQGDGTFRPWSTADADRREGASTAPLPFLVAGGIDERMPLLRSFNTAGRRDEIPENPPATIPLEEKLGLALADFDHDGRLEAFGGNGRLERQVNRFDGGRDYATVPRVLWRAPDSRWRPLTADQPAWARPMTARGVATADIDGDGDLDVVITQFHGPLVLLRNEAGPDAPWLAIDLTATQGPPEAWGARVEVHTPRRVHVQTCAPAMGLFAQSASTLYFGLGEDVRVRRVVVTWPDGTRQELRPSGINRRIAIRQR